MFHAVTITAPALYRPFRQRGCGVGHAIADRPPVSYNPEVISMGMEAVEFRKNRMDSIYVANRPTRRPAGD
jgi:hypothetical protein